jgi:HEAT repeat protein
VVDDLVEMLATEESSGTRRVLIDLLVGVARDDVKRFIPHLEDERWFVVRNLAIILGRSGHHRVGPQLRTLLKHSDHRVRVEAVRGLVLIGDGAVDVLVGALGDSHERVRQNALNLLRTQQLAGSEAVIVDAINGDGIGTGERQGLVEVLAGVGTPSARAALEDLAGRKVVLRPAQRAVRDAARAALEKERG